MSNEDLNKVSDDIVSSDKNLENALEPIQQVALNMAKALAPYQHQASVLHGAFGSVGRGIRSLLEPLGQPRVWLSGFFEVCKAVQEWPGKQREAIMKLANHGWYIDPGMPLLATTKLLQALDSGDIQGTEAVAEFFRDELDRIEATLTDHYPRRAAILHDAFEAHRTGKYNLSIPVLLAQADGIWHEQYSTSLFRGQQRTATARDHASEIEDQFFAAFFDLFTESVPLWMSASEREPSFSQLNRHLVLHGETVDYGTEENSLKAISFLSWLCWILNWRSEESA